MEFFLISMLNGLSYGLLLFMLSSGLTLIFSMMGVLNFAHASFYMLGAYFAYTLSGVVGFWAALVLAPLLVGASGAVFERAVLRKVHKFGHVAELLVTFGLALVAEQAIRMIWGAAPLSSAMPPSFKGNVVAGDFLFSRYRLFLLAVVAVAAGTTLSQVRNDVETPDVGPATQVAPPVVPSATAPAGPQEILGGRRQVQIVLPGMRGATLAIDRDGDQVRATTEQGIEIVMQKQYDINTMKTRYRLDTIFGVVNKQPEMSGIILFGQA